MKRTEIQQYIGNHSQLGGTRHYTLSDGWGRNMRCIDINSGSGLHYTVVPERGMDISLASFKGTNLVYITSNGETHPSFYEPENFGWLRTFTGGLLTTCGLTYFGAPVNDDGEQLGLHGRYSTIPARQVVDLSDWIANEYHIRVRGTVEEGHMFGHKLRMVREIGTVVGQNRIHIEDTITNFGNNPSPYTILYHMNLGYPLLSEDSELILEAEKTIPRDDAALAGINEFRKFVKPQAGFKEQVFDHFMKADSNGEAVVILKNHNIGIALSIKFRIAELPCLVQWKMMGIGEYILGLEPCNVPGKNRKTLKEEGLLPWLKPGESVTNMIEVELSELE
jgi:galactose mutarotase-like enzyme